MKNIDRKLKKLIKEDCINTFQTILNDISKAPSYRALGQLRVTISNDQKFDAQVRPTADDTLYFIDINEGVISKIFELVNSNKENITSAILDKNGTSLLESVTESPKLLDTIYDLSLQFIFHHEVSHYICGHLEYDESTNTLLSKNRSLVESSVNSENGNNEKAILRAHYLELEADATSIEWMMDHAVLDCINRELSASLSSTQDNESLNNKTITMMFEANKILAFRYVLLSVWIVIILMEANRNIKGSEDVSSHPLPSARLHGALSTMLMWYSDINNFEINQAGEMIASPDQTNKKKMVEFLQLIVKPVAKNVINFSDEYSMKNLVAPIEIEHSVDGLVEFMREFARICQRDEPLTYGGKQLEKIESIRSEIIDILENVRFIEGMK